VRFFVKVFQYFEDVYDVLTINSYGVLKETGAVTNFDYYMPATVLSVDDWKRLPQANIGQMPAGADGGFVVPELLRNFYLTGTFEVNQGGHAPIAGGPGNFLI
jgi:hypothetical protein